MSESIVDDVRIDVTLVSAFLSAVAPAGLAASMRAAELLQADHDSALAYWRLAVERADYEVQRAERRYRAVGGTAYAALQHPSLRAGSRNAGLCQVALPSAESANNSAPRPQASSLHAPRSERASHKSRLLS